MATIVVDVGVPIWNAKTLVGARLHPDPHHKGRHRKGRHRLPPPEQEYVTGLVLWVLVSALWVGHWVLSLVPEPPVDEVPEAWWRVGLTSAVLLLLAVALVYVGVRSV
jgi:hypothetical protein